MKVNAKEYIIVKKINIRRKTMNIILASASPRRKELLSLLIDDFTVFTVPTDERTDETAPERIVMDISRKKALAVAQVHPADLIISADTLVFCGGRPLGKPVDKAHAEQMLHELSGKDHEVYTGFCLIHGDNVLSDYERTLVHFCEMSEREICNYAATDEPYDKAGAYGIQGYASRFIEKIDGCYFNVVGLPVHKLYAALKAFCPQALE